MLNKWTDFDRWTEIDLDDLTAQSEKLSNDSNKDVIKDALYTIKNSFTLLEKKKSTKEKRDRMTKERINILIRLGFEIHFRPPVQPEQTPAESPTQSEATPAEASQ
ncbi:MAG: hypothetical protein M1297_04590 [Nitrospirae bacterium]|jgi:NurA-like 5'-3' nuclease|nr:hypothetical protein [Nitrospirota bacterium]